MFERRLGHESHEGRMLGLGLLLGAVVGAGAALLLAPASGVETRRVLRRKAERAYRRGSELVEDSLHDAERAARRAARLGAKRARRQAQRAREVAEELVENGRRSLSIR